ncbi:MAG: response regulator [Spirochaetaceae bacterium]|nr:MAG: response regulator [Spirochaetaceae bacterium]
MSKNHESSTVMVVDDNLSNLKILRLFLEDAGYKAKAYTNGKEALKAAAESPPDIFLLDINMPEMDGFAVSEAIRRDSAMQDVPILFISALSGNDDKLRAFQAGGEDYITKPFQFDEVQARVETHLKLSRMRKELTEHNRNLEQLVINKTKELYDSQLATIFALAKLAEHRDNDTGKHVERVQSYTAVLAKALAKEAEFACQLDDSFIENLIHATPLHDIGKVAIPDSVLLKPGKLTPEEFEIIKTHTLIGSQNLENVHAHYSSNTFLRMGVDITRSHHERWDGKGYPDGLQEKSIPLAGRIVAVADVYDALRSKRVYKPAFPHTQAYDIIVKEAGAHFDPDIIAVFSRIHREFEEISHEMAEQD